MRKSSFFLGYGGKIHGVKRIKSLFIAFFVFFLSASQVLAAECDFNATPDPFGRGNTVTVTVGLPDDRPQNIRVCNGNESTGCYQIRACKDLSGSFEGVGNWCDTNNNFPLGSQSIEGNNIIATFAAEDVNYAMELQFGPVGGTRRNECGSYPWYIEHDETLNEPEESFRAVCQAGTFSVVPQQGNLFAANSGLTFQIDGDRTRGFSAGNYYFYIDGPVSQSFELNTIVGPGTHKLPDEVFQRNQGLPAGSYSLSIRDVWRGAVLCAGPSLRICADGDTSEECNITGQPDLSGPLLSIAKFDYCMQVPDDGVQREACYQCIGGEGADPADDNKIYTAVGCISVDEQGFAADLIRLLLGIAGGVALLSILAGAFIFTTSQGESGRVKQAKELITAAVSGLFFIIFSIIILDFIGVKILQIPGLG